MSAPDWSMATAPSLDDLERLAIAAWERLPDDVRRACGDLVIRIDEFASEEVLNSLGIESPFELIGLYQGVSLDRRSVSAPPREPDMVFLYRRAILDYWSDAGDEALGDLITHVLIHEIGHHFGFSDADMEEIEAAAASR